MSIGEHIARYRKAKSLTQEQLGELLGVTNQAVSKWESGVSMPDIMLLPKIADTLSITLDVLYGIQKTEVKVRADDFPKAANDHLIEFMVKQSGVWFTFNKSQEENINYHKKRIYESGGDCVQGCVSDEAGAAFISGDISFVNTDYKTLGSDYIFEKPEIGSTLKKLTDSRTRKVLSFMYKESFLDKETNNKHFHIGTIVNACGLSEEDVFETLDSLRSIGLFGLLETYVENNVTEYIFLKSQAVFVFAAFKLFDRLVRDHVFTVRRDTSTQSDYCFEILWKNKSQG